MPDSPDGPFRPPSPPATPPRRRSEAKAVRKRKRIDSTPPDGVTSRSALPARTTRSQRYERYQNRRAQSGSEPVEGETDSRPAKPARKRKPRRNENGEVEQARRNSTETSIESWREMTPSPRLSAKAELALYEKYLYVWSYEREDSGEIKLRDLLGISEADEKAWLLQSVLSEDEEDQRI